MTEAREGLRCRFLVPLRVPMGWPSFATGRDVNRHPVVADAAEGSKRTVGTAFRPCNGASPQKAREAGDRKHGARPTRRTRRPRGRCGRESASSRRRCCRRQQEICRHGLQAVQWRVATKSPRTRATKNTERDRLGERVVHVDDADVNRHPVVTDAAEGSKRSVGTAFRPCKARRHKKARERGRQKGGSAGDFAGAPLNITLRTRRPR